MARRNAPAAPASESAYDKQIIEAVAAEDYTQLDETVKLRTAGTRPPRFSHGLTPELLVVAGVLVLPAVVMSAFTDNPTVQIILERYLIIVFVLLMISEPLYWMSQGGRTEPRLFTPELGHQIPRTEHSRNPSMTDEEDLLSDLGFEDTGAIRTGLEAQDSHLHGSLLGDVPDDFSDAFPDVDDIFGSDEYSSPDSTTGSTFDSAETEDEVGPDGLTHEERERRDRGELI